MLLAPAEQVRTQQGDAAGVPLAHRYLPELDLRDGSIILVELSDGFQIEWILLEVFLFLPLSFVFF